jgi:hypothetical protein
VLVALSGAVGVFDAPADEVTGRLVPSRGASEGPTDSCAREVGGNGRQLLACSNPGGQRAADVRGAGQLGNKGRRYPLPEVEHQADGRGWRLVGNEVDEVDVISHLERLVGRLAGGPVRDTPADGPRQPGVRQEAVFDDPPILEVQRLHRAREVTRRPGGIVAGTEGFG